MDTSSIKPVVEAGQPSRLPAGSTLEVSPGFHVPHPHAEVNLPGAGDPRLGDTKAVTEYVANETHKNDKGDDVTVVVVKQKPLADEVKPKVTTVNHASKPVAENAVQATVTGAASTAETKLAVEEPTRAKTE